MTIMMNEHFSFLVCPLRSHCLRLFPLSLSLPFPSLLLSHCAINNVKVVNWPHLHGPGPLQMAPCVSEAPLSNLDDRSA